MDAVEHNNAASGLPLGEPGSSTIVTLGDLIGFINASESIPASQKRYLRSCPRPRGDRRPTARSDNPGQHRDITCLTLRRSATGAFRFPAHPKLPNGIIGIRLVVAPILQDGLYQPSMKERMAEFEAEKAALMKRLAAPKLSNIRFHPNLAQQYRNKISNLEKVLANPATHPEAVASIRRQIDRITLTPNAEGGLDVQLYGELAQILQFCEAGEGKCERPGHGRPEREVSVVAEARTRHPISARIAPSVNSTGEASLENATLASGLPGSTWTSRTDPPSRPRKGSVDGHGPTGSPTTPQDD